MTFGSRSTMLTHWRVFFSKVFATCGSSKLGIVFARASVPSVLGLVVVCCGGGGCLSHQALGFAKLALQQFHTFAQLFLRGQHVFDADVVVGGHS